MTITPTLSIDLTQADYNQLYQAIDTLKLYQDYFQRVHFESQYNLFHSLRFWLISILFHVISCIDSQNVPFGSNPRIISMYR